MQTNQRATVDQIIYRYKDGLYCAAMLGGDSGKKREKEALDNFKQSITDEAKGFSKSETESLIKSSILLSPEAFFIVLNICNNFEAFSKVLDELRPSMKIMAGQKEQSKIRALNFFSTVLTCDPSQLPTQHHFQLYEEMRAAMLLKSPTPTGETIRSVIETFIDKFAVEGPVTALTENSQDQITSGYRCLMM